MHNGLWIIIALETILQLNNVKAREQRAIKLSDEEKAEIFSTTGIVKEWKYNPTLEQEVELDANGRIMGKVNMQATLKDTTPERDCTGRARVRGLRNAPCRASSVPFEKSRRG